MDISYCPYGNKERVRKYDNTEPVAIRTGKLGADWLNISVHLSNKLISSRIRCFSLDEDD